MGSLLPSGFRRCHTFGIVRQCQLCTIVAITLGKTQIAYLASSANAYFVVCYYPWENTDFIFGIKDNASYMHIWCPSNPGFRLVDNAKIAFYAGVLQCHLCRQYHLCTWDTLYSKLDCHPVNFHFLHIWHCLWHYVGLKYPDIFLPHLFSFAIESYLY